MLPTCDGGVVVALIRGVPAKHHVAKTKTSGRVRLCGAFEFINMQILATQNTVDVAHSHFDFLRTTFFNRFECRVYFGGGHDQSFVNLQIQLVQKFKQARRLQCPNLLMPMTPREQLAAFQSGQWHQCNPHGRCQFRSVCLDTE